jgi:hypothetical protein
MIEILKSKGFIRFILFVFFSAYVIPYYLKSTDTLIMKVIVCLMIGVISTLLLPNNKANKNS